MIYDTTFIAPLFRTDERMPICKNPSRLDNFWFINRTFFDWDNINTINVENNINYNDYEIVLPSDNAHIELEDVDNNDSDFDSDSKNSEDADDTYGD